MIRASITGAEEVIQRLDAVGTNMRGELRGGLERIAAMLQRDIVDVRLAGQVLGVRSGRLGRSIVVSAVAEDGDSLSVDISGDAPYAAFHEYGFQGVETVRAHVRRICQAFGRPIAQRLIDVRAHGRKIDAPERSFLRTALRDLKNSGAIGIEIDAAIGRATS